MKEEKVLKWRLSEKPSSENLLKLVEGGLITKEEAKKIILDEAVFSQSDIESLKDEISLLRKMFLELAEKSERKTEIIKIIEKEIPVYVEKYPYYPNYPRSPWWYSNVVWCASNNSTVANNALDGINKTRSQGNFSKTIS